MKATTPIKPKENAIEVFMGNLPEKIIKDAFVSLALSVLKEPMMTSDTKFFIFNGMFSNLKKMGYSDEDIEKFGAGIEKAKKAFMTVNSFMG